MAIRLVPLKNSVIDNEEKYLTDKMKKNLVLEKKGLFFYHFSRKANHNFKSYKILLTDKIECETQSLNEKKAKVKVVSKKMKFTKYAINYYLCETNEFRWLRDEEMERNYYQTLSNRLSFYGIVFGLPFPLIFVLLATNIYIPELIFFLTIPALAFGISKLIQSDYCSKEIAQIDYLDGHLTGFEAEYILTLKNLTPNDLQAAKDKITEFGYVRKVNDEMYRIKSPLKKEELYEEVLETLNINQTQCNLFNIGELYVMF